MNDLDAIKQSGSAAFKRKNPHIFGVGAHEQMPPFNAGGDDAEHDHISALTAKPKAKPKRIRQSADPLLNKLETEFLDLLKRNAKDVATIHPQAMRLRLANGLTFTPDFVVFQDGLVYVYEVKGPHAFEDSIVKLKVAAATFPKLQFNLVWKDDQGQWQEQHVLP